MDYYSLLRELKEGKPDRRKAAKALRILGWVSIAGGVWNFFFPLIFRSQAAFERMHLPESYPYLALPFFAYLGVMLLLAAHGVKWGRPWGPGLGRFAVVLLFLAFFGLVIFAMQGFLGESPDSFRNVAFSIVLGIGGLQFVVPVYLGVKYLGRLPPPSGEELYGDESLSKRDFAKFEGLGAGESFGSSEALYKSSPSPFGFLGTCLLFVVVMAAVIICAVTFLKSGMAVAIIFPFVIGALVVCVAFNYSSSPFEKGRTALTRYTGGGTMPLFNGSWPFFRLIVYGDAVEVRGFFHRFLVPYDKMGELPDEPGFFNRGIEINSELPGVPSTIRFYGSSNRRIMETIRQARSRYFMKESHPGQPRRPGSKESVGVRLF